MRLLILGFIFVTIAGFGCREKTIEPNDTENILTAEDVGVTDAWLKIHLTRHDQGREIMLLRDTTTIFKTTLTSQDTLVNDTGLLPRRTYIYKLTQDFGYGIKPEIILPVTTMDTTSHDFTWTIDTLGDGNNSVLYDVAIINDTLAYAVGEINVRDSLGNWPDTPYNAAVWNGKDWSLLRIQVRLDYGTSVIYTYTRLISVFAASPNDIWFVHYVGGVTRYKDGQWQMMEFNLADGPGGANKIWGTSSSNLYFVANNGRIVHYNGTSWEKLESGTDVTLTDVWGTPDGSIVWASGYDEYRANTCLLRNSGNGWHIVYDGTLYRSKIRPDSLSGAYTGVYTSDNKKAYVCSSAGVYEVLSSTDGAGKRLSFTSTWFLGFPRGGIRGNNRNDFTIAGDYTMVAHYNGYSWRYFSELRSSDKYFKAVVQKGNLAIAVGEIPDAIHSRGFVAIGKR